MIFNGDCARDDGDVRAYRQFASLIEPLREAGLAVHFTVGNHDCRERFYEVLGDRFPTTGVPMRRCMDVLERPTADWYLLDSLRKTDETPGELGAMQLDWLALRLDEKPDRPVVIVVHHPPGTVDDPTAGGHGLNDGAALMDVLRPRTQVKAIVYGHLHRWRLDTDAGIHVIGLPATSFVFRPGEPIGYVDAALSATELCLTRRGLANRTDEDGQTVRLALR